MTFLYGRERAPGSGEWPLDCEVAVVGSGAGGAVVAAHLAEAGCDVLLLEEGGHVDPGELARMRPSQTMRHAWRDAGATLAIGLGGSPMINLMMGRCVGGSSLMTGGVCFRAPEAVLAEWADLGLGELDARALDPYYADVERVLGVAETPESLRSRSTRLFEQGAHRLGYELRPMRRNVQDCVGWSRCNFGCPEQAKRSVDHSYLPRARAAGARIATDCRVDRIVVENGSACGVEGRVLNAAGGRAGDRLRVRARRVVLAAGACHTPLVLLRSGIGRRSGQVGRNLTLHPAFRVMARFDEPVEGWRGALQSAYSMHYESEGIQLNSVFVPGGILAATLPGIGPRLRERAHQVGQLALFGANLHDDAGGRVRRGIGREPWITYRMSARDRARIPRALAIGAETFLAAGAREIFLPILGFDGLDPDAYRRLDLARIPVGRLECTSQHPLGTARMGASAGRAVVDSRGQSYEVRNLFVADGSLVPTSLGVNPQLTIMALATRVAWGIREGIRAH